MIEETVVYLSLFLIVIGTIAGTFVKNYYVRLHFLGISDTVGITTLFAVLAIFNPNHIVYALLAFLTLIQGPAITHILARGAMKSKIKIEEERWDRKNS